MRRCIALALAACLSACAFSSKTPLLDPANAVTPFADGARFQWSADEGEDDFGPVQYQLAGSQTYQIDAIDDGEQPMRAQFFDLPDTPEEDYLVQVQFESGDARTYAFMWRSGDDYLIYLSPSILSHGPGPALREAHCVTLRYQECELNSADALHAIYRDLVYPSYVQYGMRQDVLVQSPLSDASQRIRPRK
ncbi:MAG: hypothetical protein WDM79_15920 [Terricaulis sp.]